MVRFSVRRDMRLSLSFEVIKFVGGVAGLFPVFACTSLGVGTRLVDGTEGATFALGAAVGCDVKSLLFEEPIPESKRFT